MSGTLKPPGKPILPPGKPGAKGKAGGPGLPAAPGKLGLSSPFGGRQEAGPAGSKPGRTAPPPLGGSPLGRKEAGAPPKATAAEPERQASKAAPALGGGVMRPKGSPTMNRLLPQRRADPPAYPKIPPRSSGPAAIPSTGKTEQLVEVVELLGELLDVENAALTVHNFEKVRELAMRKEGLARLYAELMQGVAANPVCLTAGLDEERQAHLRTMAANLQSRVDTNRRLLQANVDACNRMLRAVVTAVKDKRTTNAVYGAQGHLDEGPGVGEGMAIAYNADI